MQSNHHSEPRAPKSAHKVALYVVFLMVLAAVAVLDAANIGAPTQRAAVAQDRAVGSDGASIEAPSGDPSLPSAAERLGGAAETSPAAAPAPTF